MMSIVKSMVLMVKVILKKEAKSVPESFTFARICFQCQNLAIF